MQGEKEEEEHKQSLLNLPAVDLLTDMITGWRPKFKIVGPIPFNFDSPIPDKIIDQLTSFGQKNKERVIYLGNRYESSFKMHSQMTHKYRFKHEGIINGSFSHMAAYFRKFHSHFKSKSICGRLFKGMNPTISPSQQLTFNSNFQSGNLDAVVKVGENEYDLFMRIDTNTRGHVQWFNFSVKNNGRKKVKFNIVNFRKNKTLYNRDMKPYVYSEYQKQTNQKQWFQGGQNVKYERQKLRYKFLQEHYHEESITSNCLKFEYLFETQWQTVQFAYCPPFTYSEMIEGIKKLKKPDSSADSKNFIAEEILCQSIGGLDIPLLTITDPEEEDSSKKCILVWGRIHPGQTCGSHMLNGFLKYVCSDSEEAQVLRKKVVFKIIPMLNPDGVTVGNFRTSFCGKDLNRQFKKNSTFLIPEVKAVKQLVLKLRTEFKNRLIFFLDMHGHSVKKNVFLYGPQYQIWETSYYKTRIFPKIISLKTQIFRFYSCIFRIADFKRTTARAVLLNHIPHCYTFQASVGSYYSPQQKKDITFTPQLWQYMGKTIGESVYDYIELMYDKQITKKQRIQKINELKTFRKVQRKVSYTKNQKFNTRLLSVNSTHKPKINDKKQINKEQIMTEKISSFIEDIKKDQKMKNLYEQGHESDNFSEGGSDSEGSEDDIPQQQLNVLHKQIIDSLKQFKDKFYDKKTDQETVFKGFPKRNFQKNFRNSVRIRGTRQTKGIQMIASLRKKADEIEKEQSLLVCKKLKNGIKSQTTQVKRAQKLKVNFHAYMKDLSKMHGGIAQKASSFL